MEFKGKNVLITGSSRGIGLACARLFSEKGARIAIHYNKEEEKAARAVESLTGQGHIMICADLAQADSAQFLVDQAVEKLGTLDVLVNNAGIWEEHPVFETEYDAWQEIWKRMLRVNLLSPADLMFCAVKAMKKNHSGKIVNISSRGAFRGEPRGPAYAASKAGLNAMSQSLAQALAPENIFVYVVAPGFVETDMAAPMLNGPEGASIRNQSPLGRAALPDEVARTVVFLASKGTAFLTGAIVDVNGASYLRT